MLHMPSSNSNRLLNRASNWWFSRRCKATKLGRGMIPDKLKDMPIFQYAPDEIRNRSIRIYSWGFALSGAQGNAKLLQPKRGRDPLEAVNKPNRLNFFNSTKVHDVACGYGFTVVAARGEDGEEYLFGTGVNTNSQIGCHVNEQGAPLQQLIQPVPIRFPFVGKSGPKFLKVACGRAHTVCITSDDRVYAFGNNSYGQCGRTPIKDEIYFRSEKINEIYSIPDKVVDLVCGQDHTIFVTDKREIYSAGWGADGQTGLGNYLNCGQPTKIVGDLEGEKVISISSAADSVLACNDKGDVFGWGNSEYSQLQSATSEMQLNLPRRLNFKNVGKIVDVAAGGSMCAILNDAGQIFVWGYGILGKGPKVDLLRSPSMLPEPLFGKNEFNDKVKVVSINAGIGHFAAITNLGDLYMWGRNRNSCLGIGFKHDQYFPMRIGIPAKVKKVSLGIDHTATLCSALM